MPIQNSWVYTQTLFKAEEFKKMTRNVYQFVSQRPYVAKKDEKEKGVSVTLLIIHDDNDYGNDKSTGNKRDSNVLNTFDVTILNGNTSLPFNKGDKVALGNYLPDKSFIIGFDLILRFDSIRKVNGEQK